MNDGANATTVRNRAGELASLGSRLVRLGQMLQDDQTKIGELMRLASECRFNLNLHVVGESGVSNMAPGQVATQNANTEKVSRHDER